LPYVDNWATCDLLDLRIFESHKEELYVNILEWIKSDHTYTARFGIKMLMSHFLDEGFKPEYLDLVAGIRSDEYYVNMMRSWYFATALAKQWDATISYLEERRLPAWVHRKTIQKVVESYRVTEEQKAYLRTLR
jgi:3-methyladenine DNA glycosylase AlkD